MQGALDPTAALIEREARFVGGFGLPVWLAWAAGGLAAGALGWAMGRITLGLRADYMAIATLGIAEIVKAFLKNADWLTKGTLTVSPLPWPVPTPDELGFVLSRASYLSVVAILIVVIYVLLERAWHSPWGRMMRAIRDNEVSAAAMGKDINRRRLEMFVIGNIIIGVGGAALITFTSIFDPGGFTPLNHTFLIWVMVILGGSGNNLGTIFGALLVYIIWTMSEPAALFLFEQGAYWATGCSASRRPTTSPRGRCRCASSSSGWPSRWCCALRPRACCRKRKSATSSGSIASAGAAGVELEFWHPSPLSYDCLTLEDLA